MFGMGQVDIYYASICRSTYNPDGDLLTIESSENALSGEIGMEFTTLPIPGAFTAVLASFTICDVGGQLPQLALMDSLGNVVWEVYTELMIPYGSELMPMHFVEGNLIHVSDETQDFFYDLEGNIVELIIPPAIYEKQMLLENGFVASIDSIVYVLDSGFQIMDSAVFSAAIMDFDTLIAGGLTVLTKDSVHITDSVLNPVQSTHMAMDRIVKVMATSQSYWLVSDSVQIWELDSNLQLVGLHNVGHESEIRDALHVGDVLFVGGSTPTGQGAVELFCVRTDAGSPDFGISRNAAITDVEIRDTVRYWFFNQSTFKKVDFGRIYMTIANEGAVALNDVMIKFQAPGCPGPCTWQHQLSWKLNKLGIAPGATKKVLLDSFGLYCTSTLPSELCFWSTGPDGEPDADLSNDYFCKTIELITDLEALSEDDQISVFPNPVRSELHIQLPEESNNVEPAEIRVVDANGRVVYRQYTSDSQVSIQTIDFAPGLHYVVVQRGVNTRVVRKVLVLR